MTSASRDSYEGTFDRASRRYSDDPRVRSGAHEEYRATVDHARATVDEKKERETRDQSSVYDASKVRKHITRPKPGVEEVHVALIDNSGSNRRIAEHLKRGSGYMAAGHRAISPRSEMAWIYFSDHCDGDHMLQEVDYTAPNAEGDAVLASTLAHTVGAHGGDEPEAIECALVRACEIDFGSATKRHLYLVSDVVAHGMGMRGDDGCPDQQDWRRSLELVRSTYTSFEVIGCGADQRVADLQKQFLVPDRVAWDLIDLSNIRETVHRQAITGNALLFLMARHAGIQAVQMFLSALYEKWLSDPVFGGETDARAQDMIRRFGKYLEIPRDDVERIMNEIFV